MDETTDQEIIVEETIQEPLYYAEAAPERRRQWCLILALEHFSAQGPEKVAHASRMFEAYLNTGSVPPRSVK